MVERDVVTARLAIIDRCLARIAEVQGPDRPELRPIDVEDIIALNLQRAVQATISLASHVVATEGYGTPASTADLFTLLERGNVIDADLADRLRRMVGFRNVAIHEYQTVDPEIVAAIVERHLGDLRAFGQRIVDHFGLD